MRILLVVL